MANLEGAVTKFEANLAAIRTLRRIETEDCVASTDERSTLLRYTGWGGLPASFNLEGDDTAWLARATHLRAALADDLLSQDSNLLRQGIDHLVALLHGRGLGHQGRRG